MFRIPCLIVLSSFVCLVGTSAAEDFPCRTPEFERLSFLEGEWVVTTETRLGSGEWETADATSTIAFDLGQCLLRERYVSTRDGHPFEAVALLSYDRHHDNFQKVWADSEHGMVVFYQGPMTEEIHLEWAMSDVKLFRHVYLDITEDSFAMESRRSGDAGETWRLNSRAEYRRAGGS